MALYVLLENWREASERKWLLVASFLSAIVLLIPFGEGLSVEGQRMLALLVFFVVTFITEALPVGASFPLVLAWVVFFDVKPPAEAIASIAHDAALFMMGALMIARVLVHRNLHQRALAIVLQVLPRKVILLTAGLATFAALSSAIISDHTVAALLLPAAATLVVASGGITENPRMAKFLMISIAFSCAIGGLATPSGGSRNVVMMAYLEDIAGQSISYQMWASMALPITVLLIPAAVLVPYLMFKPEITDMEEISENLLEDMDYTGPMDRNDWLTLGIFVLVLVGWITIGTTYGIGLLAITGAFAYIVVGLADWERDYQHINWGIVWLYFAAVSFGRALQASGAALWLAERAMQAITALGLSEGLGLAAASGTVMMLFSQTMSDGPAVALLGPVFLESAQITGTSTTLVGVAAAIASSFAFMLIIGTPSNAIIYSSGYVEARDFLRAGFWMALISILVLIIVAGLWWPILGIT